MSDAGLVFFTPSAQQYRQTRHSQLSDQSAGEGARTPLRARAPTRARSFCGRRPKSYPFASGASIARLTGWSCRRHGGLPSCQRATSARSSRPMRATRSQRRARGRDHRQTPTRYDGGTTPPAVEEESHRGCLRFAVANVDTVETTRRQPDTARGGTTSVGAGAFNTPSVWYHYGTTTTLWLTRPTGRGTTVVPRRPRVERGGVGA